MIRRLSRRKAKQRSTMSFEHNNLFCFHDEVANLIAFNLGAAKEA